jgi:hypothetical protein
MRLRWGPRSWPLHKENETNSAKYFKGLTEHELFHQGLPISKVTAQTLTKQIISLLCFLHSIQVFLLCFAGGAQSTSCLEVLNLWIAICTNQLFLYNFNVPRFTFQQPLHNDITVKDRPHRWRCSCKTVSPRDFVATLVCLSTLWYSNNELI